MLEQIRPHGEHEAQLPKQSIEAEQQPHSEQELGPKAEQDSLANSLNALRDRVEQQAVSGKEYSPSTSEQTTTARPLTLQRELKTDAYRKSLKRARTQLPTPERAFSRFIHQPAIETASDITATTIARPSGLFMGSLFALIGSAFLLYVSKHYGFTYNYGFFILCFVGGFMLGVVIELLWRQLLRRHSR